MTPVTTSSARRGLAVVPAYAGPDDRGSTPMNGADCRADFTAHVEARQPAPARLDHPLSVTATRLRILQNALAKVYRHWDRIHTVELPDAYVRRIMVNENNSRWRRMTRRRSRRPAMSSRCSTHPPRRTEVRSRLRSPLPTSSGAATKASVRRVGACPSWAPDLPEAAGPYLLAENRTARAAGQRPPLWSWVVVVAIRLTRGRGCARTAGGSTRVGAARPP